MNLKKLLLAGVALVFLLVITGTSSAQSKVDTRKPSAHYEQPLTSTGGNVQATELQSDVNDGFVIQNEIPAMQSSKRANEKMQDVKAWYAEFKNWVDTTPNAFKQLDATEIELYTNNKRIELYDYRLAKNQNK